MSSILKPVLGSLPAEGHLLSDGLVGCWLMNEGSGNIVQDLSGNGNTGTFVGTAPSWSAGKYGTAVYLPGTDEYISLGNPSQFSFGSGSFTIVAYCNLYEFSSAGHLGIFVKHDDFGLYDADLCGYGIGVDGGGANPISVRKYRATVGDGTNVVSIVSTGSSGSYGINQMHQIAMVCDRNTNLLYLYIDGILDNTGDISAVGSTDTGNGIKIGDDLRHFKGLISSIHAANRALSASEITLLNRKPFCMFEWYEIVLWQSGGAPPVGNAGIMTTNTGYWGATY